MKKIVVMVLVTTIACASLVACGSKSAIDNNTASKTESSDTKKEEKKITNKSTKIEAKDTKDLITTLSGLIDKSDYDAASKVGVGSKTVGKDPVTCRQYDTKVLDEDSTVYVNLENDKVFDVSVALKGTSFEDYETKLVKIFGEKTSEEENTINDSGEGRRADIWNLENGNKLSLIQVNSTISISIEKQ